MKIILSLLSAALLAACAGDLDQPDRFTKAAAVGITPDASIPEPTVGASTPDGGGAAPISMCPDIPALLGTSCASTVCHSAAGKAGALDLESADIGPRVVGKSATGGAGLLVDRANPDKSVLYTKVSGSPPFGSPMPTTGTPFDDATKACFLGWIKTLN